MRHSDFGLTLTSAHKEDDPEKALKEFQAIIDKEQEKGDWYAVSSACVPHVLTPSQGFQGVEAVDQAVVSCPP